MKTRGIFRTDSTSRGGARAPARRHRRRRRHARVRVQRTGDPLRLPRAGRGTERRAARSALCAQGQLDAGHRAAAATSLAAAPTQTRSGRSKWRFAPGSIHPESSSPASARRPAELERAIVLGVHTINAESPGELQRIGGLARAHRTTARVALRVNPDIDARSHPHISTGLRTNKFGVPIESARALFREAAATEGLRPVGVHVHVGSQITSLDPLTSAAARIVALVEDLLADGLALDHVDLGGGLGISYDGSSVPSLTRIRRGDRRWCRAHGAHPRARARTRARGGRGPAPHARGRREGIPGRAAVRHSGRRDDRTAAARALQRLPPHRRRDAARRRAAAVRSRGAALREQRHLRPRPAAAAPRARRSPRRARHGRVWRGDGLDLQPTPAAAGGARRRRPSGASSGAARRSTISSPSKRKDTSRGLCPVCSSRSKVSIKAGRRRRPTAWRSVSKPSGTASGSPPFPITRRP